MPADQNIATAQTAGRTRPWTRRIVPLGILLILAAIVLLTDLRNLLSLETLVRHRAAIGTFIDQHLVAAVGIYVGLYIVVVALSVPGSAVLSITGGFLFGTLAGAFAAVIGATIGATILFLIARSAFGENLLRRAGPLAAKLGDGFRADAFNYLLFLRLVPAFPFWLVNLAAALFAVPLGTFFTATVIGVIPGALAFAFGGSGLDSVIDAQASAYQHCLAAGGGSACRLEFKAGQVLTPKLLGALVALGALALVPVVVKRWRARRGAPNPPR
jgi:uncharacterized membrane protein YdjX (TVP38/TMEM64 family)